MQTAGYTSPLRRGETLDIAPEDGARLGVADGELVRAVSRRGAIEVPARYDATLRPGLAFMTLHFQDDVATNILTIDAIDPKSGHRGVQGVGDPDREGRRSAATVVRNARLRAVGAGLARDPGNATPTCELKYAAWISTSSPAPTPPPRSARPWTP